MENQSAVDRILEDAIQELIDTTEAVRRLLIAEAEPDKLCCGTCRFFRPNRPGSQDGECWVPGQPGREESALSVRCNRYEWRDERAEALPATAGGAATNGSRMFKPKVK
jgi:hypothetical protein